MNIKLFFQAIEAADVNAIQEQMRCDDFDINCFSSRYRFSALHSAATKGDPIVVKFLLDVGDQCWLISQLPASLSFFMGFCQHSGASLKAACNSKAESA